MFYTHVLNRCEKGVRNPADALPDFIPIKIHIVGRLPSYSPLKKDIADG